MSPTAQAIWSSWSFDPKIVLCLAISSVLYTRGWLTLHRTLPRRFPVWRLYAFVGGLATVWLAIASPLDALSGLLLSAHMVQHLLLLSAGPPLILLGSPFLPMLRGLPRKFARDAVGPFLAWPALQRFGNRLTHPLTCWIAMAVTLCVWHVPPAFDLALRSPGWHKLEHACFFGAALLFWWPVVRPFPSRPHWPLWAVPLYLLAADLLNTILSAIFTFSDHVFYPQYLTAPQLFGTSALVDQSRAGLIMWVPGSLVFSIPAVLIGVRYLSPSRPLVRPQKFKSRPDSNSRDTRFGIPALTPPVLLRQSSARTFDLLNVPVLGPVLRAQATRRSLQALMLLIAVAIIIDGLFGPQVSSMNLAGVLPWTYWRAFVVIGLLAAGNFFCTACPFMLVRDLGRRLHLRQRAWPRALRSKWFAIALLITFFWGYEVFNLWDKPAWTAWLIINYFLIAFAIDSLFRGASFCKYVCPIGQFQFVTSLVSPLEVKVRAADICATCKTHDCLRGNQQHRGCETYLYLPRKSGNLDCTFCLDCVRACPHNNVGIMAVAPAMDVIHDPPRSSIGRLSNRADIAALALVFVAAAFTNAACMTAPVISFTRTISERLGLSSTFVVTTGLMLVALVLIPIVFALFGTRASRTAGPVTTPPQIFCRMSLSLVPLGVAMWAAHYIFHLVTGWGSATTAISRAIGDAGFHLTGFRELSSSLLQTDSLHHVQLFLLDAGFLFALYAAWRVAQIHSPRWRDTLRTMVPWASIALFLYAVGVWIILQPMEMRGLLNAHSIA